MQGARYVTTLISHMDAPGGSSWETLNSSAVHPYPRSAGAGNCWNRHTVARCAASPRSSCLAPTSEGSVQLSRSRPYLCSLSNP